MSSKLKLKEAPHFLLKGIELKATGQIIPWDYKFKTNSSKLEYANWNEKQLFDTFDGKIVIRSDCWTDDKRSFWITLKDQESYQSALEYYNAYLPKITHLFGTPTEVYEVEYLPHTRWEFQDGISVSWNVQERFVSWVNFVISKKLVQTEPEKSFLKKLFQKGK